MRIDIGKGYRVYDTIRQQHLVFLLHSGNKTSRHDDIKRAIQLAREIQPMTVKTTRFDIADYPDSEEAIREYFRQVMEEGDPDEIIRALSHIAKTRGIAQLAKDTGPGRESLYTSLPEDAKPRLDTILRITKALGLKLTVSPA